MQRALEMKMTKAAHSAMEEAFRDENRQQQQYSVAPFKQHGYVSAFPQYPPPLPQYPFQQAPPPYQRLDVQSPALAPALALAPTRSSPIPVDGNDDDVVAAFFTGRLRRSGEATKDDSNRSTPETLATARTVLEPTGPKG